MQLAYIYFRSIHIQEQIGLVDNRFLCLKHLDALWFFYRSVFQDDTILVVPIVLGLITSYLCAYALTGGKDPYN